MLFCHMGTGVKWDSQQLITFWWVQNSHRRYMDGWNLYLVWVGGFWCNTLVLWYLISPKCKLLYNWGIKYRVKPLEFFTQKLDAD